MDAERFSVSYPTRFKAVVDAFGELLADIESQLKKSAAVGQGVDYGAFEECVADRLGELGRHVHALALSHLDVDEAFVRVWGKVYRRVGRGPGAYQTMSGSVHVERTLYRLLGERDGASIDPVSIRVGAVADGWLPRTARAMAHLLAKGTSREAETTSRELKQLPYSRSSFERVGHAVGAQYAETAERVEQRLIELYEVPAEARSISVSIDRVSVPMEEPIEVVDFWHLMEYLGAAATQMETQHGKWTGQLRRWKKELLEKPRGIHRVLADLREVVPKSASYPERENPIGAAIRYIEPRVKQMRYAAARRIGLPIGSGNVEATCKSLVALRMKRPGARWKTDSGNEILRLRALYLSDRWNDGITRALSPLSKPVHAVSRHEALKRAA